MIIKTASLTPEILRIIEHKGTEAPFSGEYNDCDDHGTYLCRRCGCALFRSQTKFHSGCGWPSFDAMVPEAITQRLDADGIRNEIICARCQAHLGHVFYGEQFTAQDTRYCVNASSLDFVQDLSIANSEEAILAGGCFWGIEYFFQQLPGVVKTEVGFIGGETPQPTYEEVCYQNTGHYEAVRVVYDPNKTNYETITKYFFEIHDPTQANGQGGDIGAQYRSAIFYYDENQKQIALQLIEQLKLTGLAICTKILPVSPFQRAESYHQHYYQKNGQQPYCHRYIKRFK